MALTALLFWIYLFLLVLVFFLQWLIFHRDVLIILLPQFPLTFFFSPNEDRSHFYRLTEDCSRADCDGVCGYLRDVPLEDICKFGSSAEITYKSLLSFVPIEEIFCI